MHFYFSINQPILIFLLSFLASVQVGIVNGTEDKPHSRPYMVSVQRKNKHKRGGFLLSEQFFILTAAHCWDGWRCYQIDVVCSM
uniref:Peptidase S1 domain-containing protein n=2 Tax=Cyprinus carpio TaxID=7962 RepID=A0A8C1V1W9_CYPCA